MGKKFPSITNLKESPHFFEKTLKLIENSFNYKAPFSFEVDFAPLILKENHHNCFILIDEFENVLAHVGAKERFISINEQQFSITMLGGIAVDEKARGEGHFTTLLGDVLAEKRDETTFFLLWSDNEKLYKKFGFYLCGSQYEAESNMFPTTLEKTTFHSLSNIDKIAIQDLYLKSFQRTYLTIERSKEDWESLEKITSAQLYVKRKDNNISDYFFIGKGQDLTGIIYEYGSEHNLNALLGEAMAVGKVWTGFELSPPGTLQYQFFLAPGDLKRFSNFIFDYSGQKIAIRNINILKQEIFFDFNEELYSLEVEEFLKGVFGPERFEELDLKPFFLSGLDSI